MDMGMTQYTAETINGYCLAQAAIHKLFTLMASLPVSARSRLRGLEAGPAAVMPADTAILIEVMNLIGKTGVLVSDAGLREGILLQQL
jgi:exopolyphosphatase/pppGpp-phosphohydrolase